MTIRRASRRWSTPEEVCRPSLRITTTEKGLEQERQIVALSREGAERRSKGMKKRQRIE